MKNLTLSILSLCLFIPHFVSADEYRYRYSEAVINHSSLVEGSADGPSASAARLSRSSFAALAAEEISASALRVIELRRAKQVGDKSRRYLASRNPCNAAPIRRYLRRVPGATCEPNWEVQLTLAPNDKLYSSVYSAGSGVASIGLPQAWEKSIGSYSTVVGIIDTGIQYTHPDLKANVWRNPGEIAANNIDDDGNGYVDDIYGIDTFNNDSDPNDDQSHGTHVAGTIGAVGNNAIGMMGVNWQVSMVSCKAFGAAGTATLSSIVRCIAYLTNLKVQLGHNIVALNNSYGGFPVSPAMKSAIEASRSAQIVFVAGAGNNNSNNDLTPFYPASYDHDNIIAVGAVDAAALKASFSNYGSNSVDIFAPGVNILSTIRGSNWAFYKGTSMATPHVTGAVALLHSYQSGLSYTAVISAIRSGAKRLSQLSPYASTGALLNVNAAMEALMAPVPTATSTPLPQPTATSTPLPTFTPTPLPTATPIPSASLAMTIAVKELSAGQVEVRCVVTEGGVPLSGKKITLVMKGGASRSSPSNRSGLARFIAPVKKRAEYASRCSSEVRNANTGEVSVVKSEIVVIRGLQRK